MRVVLVVITVVSIGGCFERGQSPLDVEAPSAGLVDTSQEVPFYYYEGARVSLVADDRLVVQGADEGEVTQAVLGAGDRAGVSVDLVSAGRRGTWLINLQPGQDQSGRALLTELVEDPRVDFASRTYRGRSDGHTFIPVNRVDVAFEADPSPDEIESLIDNYGLETIREPQPDSGAFTYAFAYPKGADPLRVAQDLQLVPGIEWASPDRLSGWRPHLVPQDPYYPQQFHLSNSNTRFGVPVDINVEPAWDLSTGAGVRVAVIDDGVDYAHVGTGGDFYAPNIPYGIDMFNNPTPPDHALDPCCNDTHGTSVAGIIGAVHNNGAGGAGVAPDAYIYPIRIFRRTYPPESATFPFTQVATNAEIAQAINLAWQSVGADVINNSWGGGGPDQGITTAIDNALTYGRGGLGTVVVFSAGNTSDRALGQIGQVEYPATLSTSRDIISVGAINSSGLAANYTPDGLAIDVVAPSGHYTESCVGEIITTDHFGSDGCDDGPSGNVHYTTTFSGTSAAAPQVSGVAALLLAEEPGLTVGQVKHRIESEADAWGSSGTFGHGKLNAHHTLAPPPPPLYAYIAGPVEVPGGASCTWQAIASGGTGNYSYQWSGVLSGTGPFISGVVNYPGTLYLTVSDGQQQDADQHSIAVNPWAECLE